MTFLIIPNNITSMKYANWRKLLPKNIQKDLLKNKKFNKNEIIDIITKEKKRLNAKDS